MMPSGMVIDDYRLEKSGTWSIGQGNWKGLRTRFWKAPCAPVKLRRLITDRLVEALTMLSR